VIVSGIYLMWREHVVKQRLNQQEYAA